jgi:hypothetical protein
VIIFIRIVNPSLFQIAGDNTRRDLGSDIIKWIASLLWRSKSPFPPNPAFGSAPLVQMARWILFPVCGVELLSQVWEKTLVSHSAHGTVESHTILL